MYIDLWYVCAVQMLAEVVRVETRTGQIFFHNILNFISNLGEMPREQIVIMYVKPVYSVYPQE